MFIFLCLFSETYRQFVFFLLLFFRCNMTINYLLNWAKWVSLKLKSLNEIFATEKWKKPLFFLPCALRLDRSSQTHFHTSFVIINWTHIEINLRNAFANTLPTIGSAIQNWKHRYRNTIEILLKPLKLHTFIRTNESEEFSLCWTELNDGNRARSNQLLMKLSINHSGYTKRMDGIHFNTSLQLVLWYECFPL